MLIKEIDYNIIYRTGSGIFNAKTSEYQNKFFYLNKNHDGVFIHNVPIHSDNGIRYKILKLYENEFIKIKNFAINHICKLIYEYQKEYHDILLQYDDILFDDVKILIKPNMSRYTLYEYGYIKNTYIDKNLYHIRKTNLYEMLLNGLISSNTDYVCKHENNFVKKNVEFKILNKDILNEIQSFVYNEKIYKLKYLKKMIKAYKNQLENIHNIKYSDIMN